MGYKPKITGVSEVELTVSCVVPANASDSYNPNWAHAVVVNPNSVITSTDKDHFGTLVNQSANTLVLVGTKFPSGVNVVGSVSESTANVVTAEVSNSFIDGLYGHTLYINNVLKVSKNDTSNVEFKIVVKV